MAWITALQQKAQTFDLSGPLDEQGVTIPRRRFSMLRRLRQPNPPIPSSPSLGPNEELLTLLGHFLRPKGASTFDSAWRLGCLARWGQIDSFHDGEKNFERVTAAYSSVMPSSSPRHAGPCAKRSYMRSEGIYRIIYSSNLADPPLTRSTLATDVDMDAYTLIPLQAFRQRPVQHSFDGA